VSGGDGFSGLDIAPLKLDRRCKRSAALVFISKLSHFTKWLRVSDQKRSLRV